MAEYKDITKLAKEIADFKKSVNSPNSDYLTGYLSALSVTEGIIANIPSAEVVEVVRCKDCKHRTNKGICEKFRQRYPFFPEDDFYCGYGERKESENNA